MVYTFDRYTNAFIEGEHIVNIISINNFHPRQQTQQSIYSFPAVDPGMKILQNSLILVYLPLKSKTTSRMQTYLTDQAGRHIDLRG